MNDDTTYDWDSLDDIDTSNMIVTGGGYSITGISSSLSTTIQTGSLNGGALGAANTVWTSPSYTGGTTIWGNSAGLGNLTTGGYTYSSGYNTAPNTLKVSGDAEIEGELKIKGVSLSSRLDKIEERLGILRPNADLEQKWDELKSLGDRYRELEKDILEKEKIWDLLKK